MRIHRKALALCETPDCFPRPSGELGRKKGGRAARKPVENTVVVVRKRALLALLLVTAPLMAFAGDPDTTVPASTPKQEGYLHHVFGGPGPYLKSAAGAGLAQAKETPDEWGGGAQGYVKRFGSAFGKHVIKSSIHWSVARLRHEELGYRPSEKQGAWPRLQYALISTVITRKTTTGARTVSVSEISSVVGSGLISRLWQPASFHTFASGFGSAGISLGADAGYNVVREFWPEIRHPRRRKDKSAGPPPAAPPSGSDASSPP
jgi:hypothetical protein